MQGSSVENSIVLFIGLLVTLFLVIGIGLWRTYRRMARSGGYSSISAFVRAIPGSDEEKRDAVDLALRGVVLCLLGLAEGPFFPLLLLGLPPLFHGTRKVGYSFLGLGLADDAGHPFA